MSGLEEKLNQIRAFVDNEKAAIAKVGARGECSAEGEGTRRLHFRTVHNGSAKAAGRTGASARRCKTGIADVALNEWNGKTRILEAQGT